MHTVERKQNWAPCSSYIPQSVWVCVWRGHTEEVWCMQVCVQHKFVYVSHTDVQICLSVCTCFCKQASIHLWECVCCMMLMSHSNCVPLSSPRIKIWTPPKKEKITSWLGWNVYCICSIWLWSLILVCVSRGALFSVTVATQDLEMTPLLLTCHS